MPIAGGYNVLRTKTRCCATASDITHVRRCTVYNFLYEGEVIGTLVSHMRYLRWLAYGWREGVEYAM